MLEHVFSEECFPVEHRHHQVHQHRVHLEGAKDCEALTTIPRGDDFELLLESARQALEEFRVIVDDQDPRPFHSFRVYLMTTGAAAPGKVRQRLRNLSLTQRSDDSIHTDISVNYDTIDPDQLLTSTEVGNLLQVNPSSVKKWVNEGYIVAFRTPGGHRRIRAADLVQFLDEHKIPVPRALQEAGRRRILIVDKDAAQLKVLGRAFKRYADRIDVTLVDDGIDALIRIGATRPHLVVMDASMPGIDGVDVCRRLKANPDTSEIAVVLASAHVTASFEEAARKAGARQVVRKPVDVTTLLEELGVRVSG